jgi:hypothetical protein
VLDLSYNKFSGELIDGANYSINASVNLAFNRLSGHLPVSTLEEGVSEDGLHVLRGNMFSCRGVPQNDDFVDDYICGSENLDEAIYIFGAILGACCFVLMLGFFVISPRFATLVPMIHAQAMQAQVSFECVRGRLSVEDWVRTGDALAPHLQKIAALNDTFVEVMKSFQRLLAIVLAVSLPLYILTLTDTNDSFVTYSNTYSWGLTFAYLHGVLPAGLILGSWVVVISVCFYHMVIVRSKSHDGQQQRYSGSPVTVTSAAETANSNAINTHFPIAIAVVLVNVGVTVFINALYIYSTQQAFSASVHFGIQISLAIFRLIYSKIFIPLFSRSFQDPVANIKFRFRLMTASNLVIPCLVTVLTSPSCFQV